jgi:hypothetical protein
MNYKTLLMASAAVLFSTQAMAQDLTGAFSVPGKGQIMSDTSFAISREKAEWKGTPSSWADDSSALRQAIEYGITDNLSINGAIVNYFDVEGEYNNSHNFAYDLGAKYNMRFDDVLFQIAPTYNTYDPKSWYGHRDNDERWQKNLGVDLKAGLDLGNGVTPYIVYHIDSDIDTNHRELDQSVKFGLHKYAGKWALDGAVRYEWTKNEGWKNSTETWFDAEADYYLKDNIALGLYGSYLIDAHDRMDTWDGTKLHVKEAHEVGLRVKVLF